MPDCIIDGKKANDQRGLPAEEHPKWSNEVDVLLPRKIVVRLSSMGLLVALVKCEGLAMKKLVRNP